ncbi:tannase/feruloyl esterase family alpha/beta hydrolase [Actinomadura madurae]|uniref:tannase/feruloyl esterase family alpha/beta hydrolase n=1 Tax=Actinomadura madurae TaxID=1993 RepID=UPI0020D22276|nr:tannase/feruloyl esterase family alpha/beta hydrolase [Actinomadura madurae]MCQ0003804.1 tannase/feruloyl esterase family alpha/beta hydrolase [Actinomadura madurae]
MNKVRVPGAVHQVAACLDDLTTAGTVASGHTDKTDWQGLHSAATRNPSGVPGIQIDGYFRDDSSFNTTHGWNHDSQFVIRLPKRWNGGLVVSGAPGNRRQYANDFTISDWVLSKGYAFASTDKGNNTAQFYKDGKRPGDAYREWYFRMTQVTVAAKATVHRHYGKAPRRTYAAGISNGGQLVRWALENHPELYDGGIDSEGTLWPRKGRNALTYLPVALRNYPKYKATGDPEAHAAMLKAASPRARSSCGTSTTRPSGTAHSEGPVRSSTPPTTATWTRASRTARAAHPTATPTTSTSRVPARCTTR